VSEEGKACPFSEKVLSTETLPMCIMKHLVIEICKMCNIR